MSTSGPGSLSLLSLVFASLTLACGEVPEQLAADDYAGPELEEAQQALTLPPLLTTKGCSASTSFAAFSFRCGAQGFRRVGVFDGGSNAIAYDYARNPSPWIDETSYPNRSMGDPVDQDGALIFGGLALSQAVPSGMYRVQFVSPDLSANAGWQGKTRYRFRALEAYSVTQVFGQIVLEVQKPDGTTGFFREVNASNEPVFCSLTHGVWTDCAATIPLPAGHHVKALQIRIFGDSFAAGEGAAFIDDVAPLG